MTSSNDLTRLDGATLGAMIAAKDVSSVEVTRACLDRIADTEAEYKAFLHVAEDAALAAAARVDDAVAVRLAPVGGRLRLRASRVAGIRALSRRYARRVGTPERAATKGQAAETTSSGPRSAAASSSRTRAASPVRRISASSGRTSSRAAACTSAGPTSSIRDRYVCQ